MRRIAIIIILSSLVFCFSPAWAKSDSQIIKLSKLNALAKIIRDDNGIAHIFARNEHDVFFLQGYVHAKDRLFQMDVTRHTALGTLAELVGFPALESDVFFRTMGLKRASENSLAVYSSRARRAMAAYTAGVNAYVAQYSLPLEYATLELNRFEPWTSLDSVAVIKYLAFILSFNLDDLENTITLNAYKQTGDAFGFDGTALYFEDLYRSQPFELTTTIPIPPISRNQSRRQNSINLKHIHPSVIDMSSNYIKRAREIPVLRQILNSETKPASNEWVVSGAHTATGLPILANDPHLPLNMPSTFYPVHLKTGRLDVIGSSFAGVPAVILGHNRHIAWGATVNRLDVVDIYQEQVVVDNSSPSGFSTLYNNQLEHVLPVPEVYRVNINDNGNINDIVALPPGGIIPNATLIVPRRNHGPIIQFDETTGFALSVQFTGFSPTRELDAFLFWNSARNLNQFIKGLRYFDFGSMNFAYADIKNNIAYFTSAELPIREDLQAGTINGVPPNFIRNGQGGNEWLPVQNRQRGQAIPYEILPFKEMPKLINPSQGWFVNANNDPAGTTVDNNPFNTSRPNGGIYYSGSGFASGLRASRITTLLQQKLATTTSGITPQDMQAIQADMALRDAEVLMPYINQAFNNAQRDGANPQLAAFATNSAVVEAVGRLSDWDYTTPTGIPEGYDASDDKGERYEPDEAEIFASVAATIYSVWRGQFIINVLDDTLKPFGLPPSSSQRAMEALRNLLDNFSENQGIGASGINFFAIPSVEHPADRRDIIILQSLSDALDRLSGEPFALAFDFSTDQDHYRWGKLHRIVFEHILGIPYNVPPAGGAFTPPLENLPGIPTDGGFQSVDASPHNLRAQNDNAFMFAHGPAQRMVAKMTSSGILSQSIWPGGISGELDSTYYINLLPLWLTNDTIPLKTNSPLINTETEKTTLFIPQR